MLQFSQRPGGAPRTAFENRAQNHINNVNLMAPDGDIDYAGINEYFNKSGNQIWKTGVKEEYAGAQHRKCGYCERKLTDWGDVEHFRPKGAIFKVKTKGREKNNLNNVEDRTYYDSPDPGTCASGFWWLAYSWDNYLLACGICNQSWKSALFPIPGGHRRRPRPGDEDRDHYLLDPFGDKDPSEHLEFSSVGGIKAHNDSRYGRHTIEVCGLDRPSVMDSRSSVAKDTYKFLQRYLEAADEAAEKQALEDLADIGEEDRPHAGMVRTIVRHTAQMTWGEFHQLLASY